MVDPPHDWEDHVRFAEALAVAAASQILPYFRTRPTMDNKLAGGFDPVTEADRAGERAMRAMIEASFPDHGILGEEYGAKPARSPYTWVLDPVDGTRSFVCGLMTWTTLVGLSYEGRPVVGVMHQPYVGETFVGSPAGSVLKYGGEARRLVVNAAPSLDRAVATTTGPDFYRTPRQRGFLDAIARSVRFMRYDGDAYFFCLLAAGQIDIAIDAGLHPYDIVALVPIIEGAGGIVTTWDGGSAGQGGDIIAAASRTLFDQARALLPES